MYVEPSARAGSIKLAIPSLTPCEGNQPRFKEKRRISKRPVQKTGIETPSKAITKAIFEGSVFGFVPEYMPTGMAIGKHRIIDVTISIRVFGKRAAIWLITGSLET